MILLGNIDNVEIGEKSLDYSSTVFQRKTFDMVAQFFFQSEHFFALGLSRQSKPMYLFKEGAQSLHRLIDRLSLKALDGLAQDNTKATHIIPQRAKPLHQITFNHRHVLACPLYFLLYLCLN
ncbi:MAG: hypothetical protein BWY75_02633 [bacterium ADurb.Bin425]|nr:MAG: hypothetical protein BWY75_02633 [bacterium ADurb.Bin425]